jgi:hypothetical protein
MTNFVYRFSFPASPTEALAQVGFSFIISRFANRSFSAGWFIVYRFILTGFHLYPDSYLDPRGTLTLHRLSSLKHNTFLTPR